MHNTLKLANVNEEKLKAQLSLKWNDFNQSAVPEVDSSVRGVLRGEVWQYGRKSSENLGPVTAACRHRAGGMRLQYKFIND